MRLFSRFKQAAHLVICLCLAMGLTLSLVAQGTNATLSGNVTDASGAAVAGATVVVKNTATAQTQTVKTDSQGRYSVPNLIPGMYEVATEAAGFSKKVSTGITLQVSQQAQVNVALAVGSTNDTVSVQAEEALTQTESSENGTVIENKKVVELPLSNRQFYSLALLSPGAYPPAQTSTLGFRGGFNVAGATEETNLFTYNGTYDSSIGTQQPSYRPSIETIQEFKLLTGVYGPEYGKYSGAQIVVLEKQGSNSFHGSAYEFIRNQASDAKPYFTQKGGVNPAFRQNTFGGTVGGPIIKDKTFFFGAYEGQRVNTQNTQKSTIPSASMLAGVFPGTTTLYNPYTGAPLVKTTVATPTSPVGTYDLHQISQYAGAAAQLGQAFAAYYPSGSAAPAPGVISTDATVYPTNNFIFSSTQIEKMNEWTVRIDHTISAKDNLNASYQEFHDPTFEPANVLCGSATIPNGGCNFNQMVHLVTFQEAHIFTPNLLNTFTFGYNRFQMPRTPLDASLPNVPLLPGASLSPVFPNLGLPNISVSGYSTLGGPTNIPQNQWLNQYNLVDGVSWNHGAHSFKFGVEGLLAITTEVFIQNGRGTVAFNSASLGKVTGNGCAAPATTCFGTTGNSAADLLLGVPYTTTRNPSAPNVHEGDYSFYGYFADNWKIRKNLTLNLGVRYEMNSPAYDSKNVISRFNPNATNSHGTQGVIEVGLNTPVPAALSATPNLLGYFSPKTFRYLYNFDWNNVAPRVGFSWQPYGGDATVVKGAYGIFYNGPIEFNQYISSSTQLPVRQAQTFTASQSSLGTPGVPSLTLANPFPVDPTNPALGAAAPGTFTDTAGTYTLTGFEPHQPTPYIHEWSLGVQQALTSSLVLEMVYLGTHGSHLANSRSINYDPTHTANQKNRIYPQFGAIAYAQDSDSSTYHSLQTKLQQTYKNGVSYLVAYTYGKSIDQNGGTGSSSNSSTGTFQDPTNPRGDRGLSDFDIRHRIAISPVVELPFGKGKPYLNHGIESAIFGGFQISGIFQFQTGRPFSVAFPSSSNISGTFIGGDRPNIVAGLDPNAGPKTVTQWFNTSAFCTQGSTVTTAPYSVAHPYTCGTTNTFGNAGRNIVIGPGLTQLDATIAREFPIYERFKGQLRVEGFNVLNHPNFFNPFGAATQPGTSSFGSILNAYNGRELQAALRLTF